MGKLPLFDRLHKINFDTVLKLYGQDCRWIGTDFTELVFFNDPTKEQKMQMIEGRGLNHVAYNNAEITGPYIEFREGQFPNLWQLVYAGTTDQYVYVNDELYICQVAQALFDGQNYILPLTKSEYTGIITEFGII